MKKIQFVTTTVTFATKGKEALKAAGISADINKVQGGVATGCLFGITVSESDATAARQILEQEKIRIISVKEV